MRLRDFFPVGALVAALTLGLGIGPATAQNITTYVDASGNKVSVSASNPLPVTGGGGGGGGGAVYGPTAAGSAPANPPVLVGGSDGTNVRTLKTDTTGQVVVGSIAAPVVTVGAAASGSALSGNPVLVGGSDGTNARSLRTATTGNLLIEGVQTNASAATGNGIIVGGSDGTNYRHLKTDTTGAIFISSQSNQVVVGNAAAGATDSLAPVKVGGVYNSTLPTYTTGQRGDLQIGSRGSLNITVLGNGSNAVADVLSQSADGQASSTAALSTGSYNHIFNGTSWDRLYGANAAAGTTGTGVQAAGVLGFDGTNYQRLKTDATGQLYIANPGSGGGTSYTGGAAATTTAAGGTIVGGTDGTNYRHLKVNTAGDLSVTVGTNSGGSLNIQGNVIGGGTDTGTNPVKVGGVYNSTLPTYTTGQRGDLQLNAKGMALVQLGDGAGNTASVQNGGSDAYSGSNVGLLTTTFNRVFNGTNWDRTYSASAAANTTGTGLQGVGVLGFDGTNYQRLKTNTTGLLQIDGGGISSGSTDAGAPIKVGGRYNASLPTFSDGQRGDLQLTSRGSVLVSLTDGNSGPALAPFSGALGDAVTNTVTGNLSVVQRALVFNGTTWDRQRGGTTGTWVTGPSGGPLTVASTVSNPSSTYTRPADTLAYAAGDLIANSTTAGSVVVQSFNGPRVAAGSFRVSELKLSSNITTGMDSISMTVDLWTGTAPTFTNGDNGAYAPATTGAGANHIGRFSGSCVQFADGATCYLGSTTGFPKAIKLASGQSVFWTLRTDSAFTPQSAKTFTLTPMLDQD